MSQTKDMGIWQGAVFRSLMPNIDFKAILKGWYEDDGNAFLLAMANPEGAIEYDHVNRFWAAIPDIPEDTMLEYYNETLSKLLDAAEEWERELEGIEDRGYRRYRR